MTIESATSAQPLTAGCLDPALVDEDQTEALTRSLAPLLSGGGSLEALGHRAGTKLEPELIMTLMRKRLDSLDTHIQGVTVKLNTQIGKADTITKQLEALRRVKSNMEGHPEDQKDYIRLESPKGSPHLIQDKGKSMHAKDFLEMHGVDLDSLQVRKFGRGTRAYTAETLDEYAASLEQKLARTNSNNELDMISMQTAMQQRAEAIELGTSIIKALHEAKMSILRNVT